MPLAAPGSGNAGTILLSLASRQAWPHVLTTAHLSAQRVVLLHSSNDGESSRPATRLKAFFDSEKTNGHGPDRTDLREIPSDDFVAIKHRLSETIHELDLDKRKMVVNFTGGNKLMATAAYEWARDNGLPACYLERGNVLFSFTFDAPGAEPVIRHERLDAHLLRHGDAIALLRAQLDESVIRSKGERLTLQPARRAITQFEIKSIVSALLSVRTDAADLMIDKHLVRTNSPNRQVSGDRLEYAAAIALLGLGVPAVYRGVELRDESINNVQSETDLVFNWGGRLWMVDCKDKISVNQKLLKLTARMRSLGYDVAKLSKELDALKDQLTDTDKRLLKEDILHISEMGGLLGSAIAVRRSEVSDDVIAFAANRRTKVEIVYAKEMVDRFRGLLRVP